jgi:AcrR family transcriptional regulator
LADDTPLRADAQRNRERLLAAAEEVFLERGADASMDDVAKRAGVGIGTLYRRFPTRESLLAAAYSAHFLSLAEASQARSATLDPLTALQQYLQELTVQTGIYRGMATSLGALLHSGTPGCDAMSAEGRRLLQQAQQSGAVRAGVSFEDLVAVAVATSLAAEQAGSSEKRIAQLLGLFFDGIASPARQAARPAAPGARRASKSETQASRRRT